MTATEMREIYVSVPSSSGNSLIVVYLAALYDAEQSFSPLLIGEFFDRHDISMLERTGH